MLGASCLGKGSPGELGQGHDSGRPWQSPWRAVALAGRVASSGAAREGRVQANQGRGAGFGRRRDAWAARWPRRRTDAARRPSAGRREVEEPASGSSVIFSKFKNPVM